MSPVDPTTPLTRAEETAEVPGVLPESLTDYVSYLLRRVHAQFSSTPDGTDTDSRDFLVLDALTGQDWASQLDLAERLGINRTIMVQVIDRLEARGEVRRTRNPDNRRQYVLSLTDRGRDALGAMRRAVAERDAGLTAVLTPQEIARLDELLTRLLPESAQPLVQGTEYLVAQVHFRLRRHGDDKLAGTGLRVRHYGPLSALVASGPCSQQQLAEHLAITGPAVSQLVDELVEQGLVRRGRDPHDRRRYALEVTDEGREKLVVVTAAVQELADDVAALLGPGGEEELRTLLLKLLQPASDSGEHSGSGLSENAKSAVPARG
ncbi:MarR family winged helix-turn-helix transcriptional regulator [Streptomyces chromofuscus]|uniref:Winged helix-turn-helix transcriptional regulator n=1 Tax=Streptomyces chromofuscus TaxID=42881 RepID=A0A7M2THG8_STRCW|nr:MarR family winged helix-turn-helix transcriptional regulator [Streptomyces chromofuscus]QOV47148.1 winged helix-turn-helix transcriptional regulator [Streptomyces chromofuscus]